MNNTAKYAGFGWIKVPRARPVEIDGISYVPEEHHVAETEFLIAEVRKLAAEVDHLRKVNNTAGEEN